ncbi:hypothetical protein QTO34_004882 [Cnephaeus nilssonii]|uniref:DUF4371 domain-containing protein n=1 Tax=Cnephaeus nilssonii TaxID=3371016 RepID=A0AA40LKA4_CNENI|nr:hypothetical protein QTO34_004882 [Eptesicus nilssonii]
MATQSVWKQLNQLRPSLRENTPNTRPNADNCFLEVAEDTQKRGRGQSRNIIKDRIMRLNTNVQHQLKRDIRKCKYFSIFLDETTDVTSHAQLAIIGRYSDGLTMREELIKLVSVPTSKSGSKICKVVIQTFHDLSIDISKGVSVTTDGAPNMVGEKVGFVKLFTEAIGHPIVPFHCIIHQEALCAKAGFTDLNDLTLCTRLLFSRFLYSNAVSSHIRHPSAKGKVLERFVECFEEIKVFLDDKDLGNFPQLNDAAVQNLDCEEDRRVATATALNSQARNGTREAGVSAAFYTDTRSAWLMRLSTGAR